MFWVGLYFSFVILKCPKHAKRILVDRPWKFKSNTVLSLICRGVLTIQSNIWKKSVGKTVNGVWPDYNVRDQNNGP